MNRPYKKLYIAIVLLILPIFVNFCAEREDFTEIHEAPLLISPINGYETCDQKVDFHFEKVDNAKYYELVVNGDPIDIVVNGRITKRMPAHLPGYIKPAYDLNYSIEPYKWVIRAGNEFQYYPSETRSLLIKDCYPPTVAIVKPEKDDTIYGDTTSSGSCNDNVGVIKFAFRIDKDINCSFLDEWASRKFYAKMDGTIVTESEIKSKGLVEDKDYYVWYEVDQSKTFAFNMLTTKCEPGMVTLHLQAWDEAGNIGNNQVTYKVGIEAPRLITPGVDSEGKEVTKPAQKAYICDTNKPDFKWTEARGAETYQIEISTISTFDPIFYTHKGTTSTTFKITTPMPNGGYYWRVRGINLAGYPGEWSGINYLVINLLSPPTLKSPPDNRYDEHPYILNPVAEYEWNEVSEANGYKIEICRDSSFSSFVSKKDVRGSVNFEKFTPSYGLEAGTYYWRVRAITDVCSGQWSEVWVAKYNTIDKPIIINPTCGIVACASVSFEWTPIPGSIGYMYQLAYDPNCSFDLNADQDLVFSMPYFNVGTCTSNNHCGMVNNTTFTPIPADLPTGCYYMRVRAASEDGGGTMGKWSDVCFFEVQKGVDVIMNLLNPGDGSATCNNSVTLEWAIESDPEGYQLQVTTLGDTFPSGGEFLDTNITPITTTTYDLNGLNFGTYHWRLVPQSGACYGNWNNATKYSFNIKNLPTAPTQTAPADTATLCDKRPNFTWNSVPNAYKYVIQIDNADPIDEGSLVYTKTDTFTSMTPPFDLPTSTQLFWRVKAITTDTPECSSPYSDTWEFVISEVGTPAYVSPAKNDTICTDPAPPGYKIEWSSVAGAAEYWIQIKKDNSNFSAGPYFLDHKTANTSYTYASIPAAGTYYWRVAVSKNSFGAVCEPLKWIQTDPAAPLPGSPRFFVSAKVGSTSPVNPCDGKVYCSATGITLSWATAAGVDHYLLNLYQGGTGSVDGNGKLNSGTAVLNEFNNGAVNTKDVSASISAMNKTRYYWQVKPIGDPPACPSSWTTPRSFYVNNPNWGAAYDWSDAQCKKSGSSTYTFNWQTPLATGGSGDPVEYYIQVKHTNTNFVVKTGPGKCEDSHFAYGNCGNAYSNGYSVGNTTTFDASIGPGLYYFRVMARSSDSTCPAGSQICSSGWSTIHNYRVFGDITPKVLSPIKDSIAGTCNSEDTCKSPAWNHGIWLCQPDLNMSWTTVSGSAGKEFNWEIKKGGTMWNSSGYAATTSTSYTLSAYDNYTWQIRAREYHAEITGYCESVWTQGSFVYKTMTAPTASYPNVVNCLADNATGGAHGSEGTCGTYSSELSCTSNFRFSWENVADATDYWLELCTNPTCSNVCSRWTSSSPSFPRELGLTVDDYKQSITTTYFDVTDIPYRVGGYYWKVSAYGEAANDHACISTSTPPAARKIFFGFVGPPSNPSANCGTQGSIGGGASIALSWDYIIGGGNYFVEVRQGTTVVWNNGGSWISTESIVVPGSALSSGINYNWRVRAGNDVTSDGGALDCIGDWADGPCNFSFTP